MPNSSYPSTPPGGQEDCMFVLDNVIISSEYATNTLFYGGFPNEIRNSRHSNGTTTTLLGTPYDRLYVDPTDPVATPIKLNWGRSHTVGVILTANSAFVFEKPYVGVDTPMTLLVYQGGGPFTMTWPNGSSVPPATMRWSGGTAPTGTANTAALYQFRYDGSFSPPIIWATKLGEAM
jgi:hypothetical protein